MTDSFERTGLGPLEFLPSKQGTERPLLQPTNFRIRDYDVVTSGVQSPRSVEDLEQLEAPFKYRGLTDEQRASVHSLLCGNTLLHKLPLPRARLVKIYMSSNYTDAIEERNVLVAVTYPKLKEYCRAKHGVEFQVIDLRWGLPIKSKDDEYAVHVCLHEIVNCQQMTSGPHFMAFIGQKYGYVPLPYLMGSSHYEHIYAALVASGQDVSLLDEWYKEDGNNLPPVHVLQQRDMLLGKDRKKWWDIEDQLRRLLTEGTELAVNSGDLDKEVLEKLKCSVLDQETTVGMSGKDVRYNNSTFCYVRNISDLQEHADSEKATRFCDMKPNTKQVDKEANIRLKHLHENITRTKSSSQRMATGDVSWCEPRGIDKKCHKDYLEHVSNSFYMAVRDLIDEGMEVEETKIQDELYNEVLNHWLWAKERLSVFVDRPEVFQRLWDYIAQDSEHPLILSGLPGCGKTALIARAAAEVAEILNDRQVKCSVIMRFLGMTPDSTSIRLLLRSLCHQISFNTQKYQHKIPEDFHSLKKYFIDLVQKSEFRGMMLILLDSIDQLSPHDGAFNLEWLPSHIANNVKIVVTSQDSQGVLSRLQRKIGNENSFYTIQPIKSYHCSDVIKTLLSQNNRKLQSEQWRVVEKGFFEDSSPLFAKLMTLEVGSWPSYKVAEQCDLAKTTQLCLQRIFLKLEDKHGRLFMSHVLSYITATRHGMSEAQLDDILSLDDDVINAVCPYWEPEPRRCPPIFWAKLRYDLRHWLVVREVDNIQVTTWKERQIEQFVYDRYMTDGATKRMIHSVVADYYLGKWAGTFEKPYKRQITVGVLKKTSEGKGLRFMPRQPLVFKEYSLAGTFNLSKLNQLPYNLAHSGRYDELRKEVLFNYNWIYTKMKALSPLHVTPDYDLFQDEEARLVGDALKAAANTLNKDLNVLGVELSGRLLPHIEKWPNIRKLLHQCDLNASTHCPLVPFCQMYATPGGPLQYVCEVHHDFRSKVDGLLVENRDGVILAAKPKLSTTLHLWDVMEGDPKKNMTVPVGDVFSTTDGKFINVFKADRFLTMYNIEQGELYLEVDIGVTARHTSVYTTSRYVAFTLEKLPSPYVIDIEAKALVHKFTLHSKAVGISNDNRYLACNSDHQLMFYALPLMQRRCVAGVEDVVEQIVFTRQNTRFLALLRNKQLSSYSIDLVKRSAKCFHIIKDIEMREFKMSHSEQQLLVRSARCLYLIDSDTHAIRHRVQHMPSGVYIDPKSTYTGAGFTPNDTLLVAVRHTYLGVWNATTTEPLRLLQTNVSEMSKLFTSSSVNKVVTLLSNDTIQVWNLDNMLSEIDLLNETVDGPVTSFDMSTPGLRLISASNTNAEAKLINMENGKKTITVQHTHEFDWRALEVIMSPHGKYVITRSPNDVLGALPCPLFRQDQMWDAGTGNRISSPVSNSRWAFFSPDDSIIVHVVCSTFDTSANYAMAFYQAHCIRYPFIDDAKIMDIRLGSIICPPFVSSGNTHLVYIEYRPDVVPGERHEGGYNTYFALHTLFQSRAYRPIYAGHELCADLNTSDRLLDIRSLPDNNVLIAYGVKAANMAPRHNEDGTVNRLGYVLSKGALIYSVTRNEVLRRIKSFCRPDTHLGQFVVSSLGDIIIDDKFRVFRDGQFINQLEVSSAGLGVCTLLNGKYATIASKERREIHILRCNDGYRKARIYVHSAATIIKAGANDRTVAVGCQDGRIMIFTIILDISDPVRDVISMIPSRSFYKGLETPKTPLYKDVFNLSLSQSDHTRLVDHLEYHRQEDYKRPPSFKTLNTAVELTQSRVSSSMACAIQ